MLNRKLDIDVATALGCAPETRLHNGGRRAVVCPCSGLEHAEKDVYYWTRVPILKPYSSAWEFGGQLIELMEYGTSRVYLEKTRAGWVFSREDFRETATTPLAAVGRTFLRWAEFDKTGFKEAVSGIKRKDSHGTET